MAEAPRPLRRERAALTLALVVGVGLIAAPAAFQMFTRAPQGAAMLDDFRPLMRAEVLTTFQEHLDRLSAAHTAVSGPLASATDEHLGVPAGELGDRWPAVGDFVAQWPVMEEDLRSMVGDIRGNLDRFAAVDALPSFRLFPWFFVAPGVALALIAGRGLAALRGGGRAPTWTVRTVAVVGIGLVAAPLAFQMFSRAPAGARMLDSLRPLMTAEQITTVQGYFVTLGAAEGTLRTDLLPALGQEAPAAVADPALAPVDELVGAWPQMAADMAPLIGAMADHLDSFAAIDALPPFGLFPWFFVLPGVLLVAAGVLGGGARAAASPPTPAPQRPLEERSSP